MDWRCEITAAVTWPKAADALGLSRMHDALPTVTTCPLCQAARLYVYDDAAGGCWAHCRDCRFSGNLVDLAAKLWDTTPEAALHQLACEHGASPDQAAAAADHWSQRRTLYQRRVADSWREAQRYLASGAANVGWLRQQYGLGASVALNSARWGDGPARLLGALPYRRLAEVLSQSEGRRPRGVFIGPGWADVLVVPFYDVPERICGFYAVGRKGVWPADHVYRTVPTAPPAEPGVDRAERPGLRDAGLSFLPLLTDSPNPLGRYAVVVDDVIVALRLQLRNFQVSTRPLPIVAWHADGRARTGAAWSTLAEYKPVVWATSLTAQAIQQARWCNGMISLAGSSATDNKALGHYLRLKTPPDILRRVVGKARPWRDALTHWAKTWPETKVDELLLELQRLGVDLPMLTDEVPALRPYTRALITTAPTQQKIIKLDRHVIHERDSGWYLVDRHGPRLLSDTIVRIEEVYTPAEGEPHYRGYVRQRDCRIDYDEPAAIVERRTATWLAMLLIKNHRPRPCLLAGWKTRLLDVAVKFRSPLLRNT